MEELDGSLFASSPQFSSLSLRSRPAQKKKKNFMSFCWSRKEGKFVELKLVRSDNNVWWRVKCHMENGLTHESDVSLTTRSRSFVELKFENGEIEKR
jgi:hypothetical protein